VSLYISIQLQRQVREQFAGCCAYCRSAEVLSVCTYEIEHIVPVSAGGPTSIENLCLSCPTCNRLKGARTIVTDPLTGRDASIFHAQNDDWETHFSWNASGTEIVSQTATGRGTIELLRMNRPALVELRLIWVAANRHPPFAR